jgi:hypothetical protein
MQVATFRRHTRENGWLECMVQGDAFLSDVTQVEADTQRMTFLELFVEKRVKYLSFRPWNTLDLENNRNVLSVVQIPRLVYQPLRAVHLELYRIFYVIRGKWNRKGDTGTQIPLDKGFEYPPVEESTNGYKQSNYPLRIEMVKIQEGAEMGAMYRDTKPKLEFFAVVKTVIDGIFEPITGPKPLRLVCETRTYDVFMAPPGFQPKHEPEDVLHFIPQKNLQGK